MLADGATSDENKAGQRFPLPIYGALAFALIRVLSLAVAAFLLPRGRFHSLHLSLYGLIKRGDSGYYLFIAAHGYSHLPGRLHQPPPFAWFPGYPAAIDAIAWIPGIGMVSAGLAVTFAAGLAAAWGLSRLAMTVTGDRRVSLVAVVLWALAPGSIVLSMLYSEALFCALAVWALVAMVERRWLTAAVLTILAGTVRSTAVALIAAIAVGALPALIGAARAREPVAVWWRQTVALLLAPLGLLGYWVYVARALHRPGGWFWLEQQEHNGFDWGYGALSAARSAIMDGPRADVAMTLLVLAAAVVLTACSLTVRMPWCLHSYTLVVVFAALTSGPLYLESKPRFLLPAMLLGLPLAFLLAKARTWVLAPLIVVLAALSTWFGLYLLSMGQSP
jgi:Mannosyltransferase (PIG-V)